MNSVHKYCLQYLSPKKQYPNRKKRKNKRKINMYKELYG